MSHSTLSPSPGARCCPQLPRSPRLWEGHGTELRSQMARELFFSLKHLKYEKKEAKHQLPEKPISIPACPCHLASRASKQITTSRCPEPLRPGIAAPGAELSPARSRCSEPLPSSALASVTAPGPSSELQTLLQIKDRQGFIFFFKKGKKKSFGDKQEQEAGRGRSLLSLLCS